MAADPIKAMTERVLAETHAALDKLIGPKAKASPRTVKVCKRTRALALDALLQSADEEPEAPVPEKAKPKG